MEITHKLILEDINDSLLKNASYILCILNCSSKYVVETLGTLDLINFENGILAYIGNLEGFIQINNIDYDVIVTLNKNLADGGIYSSVTLNQRDVDNTKNIIGFSVGMPFVTVEMINSLNKESALNNSNNELTSISQESSMPEISDKYLTVKTNINSSGNFYNPLGMELLYNNYRGYAAVNVFTDCADVVANYGNTNSTEACSISKLTVGIKSSDTTGGILTHSKTILGMN